MSFQAIDVVDETGEMPSIEIVNGCTHLIYIDKDRYDYDIQVGLEDTSAIVAQVDKDIHRCELYYDNLKTLDVTQLRMSDDLMRYCTQAVMALPISLIRAQIVESVVKEPMLIHASPNDVYVQKKMSAIFDDQCTSFVTIGVLVSSHDVSVRVTFEFSPFTVYTDIPYCPVATCTRRRKHARPLSINKKNRDIHTGMKEMQLLSCN